MKKNAALLMIIALIGVFFYSFSFAEGKLPSRYVPILEAWDANDGKELRLRILEYWNESLKHGSLSWPMNIRFGGTTKELIDEKESWDLAIVSSKDVDLQKLADEGLIMSRGYVPSDALALHQWLLSDALQNQLPVDPILMYDIYCYEYDALTNDATLFICQENMGQKKNSPRTPHTFALAILNRRSADKVRMVEGLSRVICSSNAMKGSPDELLQRSPDELLLNPKDWDIAEILIHDESELDALDQAGLLYDFSQDAYWLSRNMEWPVPNGIFGSDGRMIAIPYVPWRDTEPGSFWVSVVNAQCPNIPQALAYAKHFVQSSEWLYPFTTGKKSMDADVPKEIQKYGICIYKDEVDW